VTPLESQLTADVARLRARTHELQEQHDRECSLLRKQLKAVKRSRDFRRACDDLSGLSRAESREVFAPIFDRRLSEWYRAFKALEQVSPLLRNAGIYVEDGESIIPCHHRSKVAQSHETVLTGSGPNIYTSE